MNLPEVTVATQPTKALLLNIFFIILLMVCGHFSASAQQAESTYDGLMVRIAEIEVYPAYLNEYKTILAEEAAASIKLEPGVIAIFPMYQREKPSQVRILEIYANRIAYEQHLETPHFREYKNSTLHMVKSLKLVDMKAIDEETLPLIFKKMRDNK